VFRILGRAETRKAREPKLRLWRGTESNIVAEERIDSLWGTTQYFTLDTFTNQYQRRYLLLFVNRSKSAHKMSVVFSLYTWGLI